MNLRNVMLNKMSQTGKEKWCLIPLMWSTTRKIKGTETREDWLSGARWGRWGGYCSMATSRQWENSGTGGNDCITPWIHWRVHWNWLKWKHLHCVYL
jgi:hypothetical protein